MSEPTRLSIFPLSGAIRGVMGCAVLVPAWLALLNLFAHPRGVPLLLVLGKWMKRAIWPGIGTSASISCPSTCLRNCNTSARPRFGMKGKGCAGSMASGVKTG